MASIDERVVEMRFNRDDFLRGTEQTLGALEKLDGALGGGGALSQGVDKIGSKMGAFGALAFTALQRVGNAAMDAGMKAVQFVMDPLFEGGKKRALNIEQARFQFQGLGMDVDASMNSALEAVKGTAYGLDEAAVVAAQFGASGMQAGDDMTRALRGISGVAAMAGSSYSDIGNVFTKVAGQGRLMGDDLNRLGTRGVNAAATLSEYFRKTGIDVNATEESIRDLVTKGQIDFQTFADAMSDAFGEHATKANETYTGSLSNMRAALSRIGAAFATPNFEKQRVIFNALTPLIDKVAGALKPVISLFTEFSQISAIRIENFLNSLVNDAPWATITSVIGTTMDVVRRARSAFESFVGPVVAAFKAVFMTGSSTGWLMTLQRFLRNVSTWLQGLKLTKDEAAALQSVMENFFRVIHAGVTNYLIPLGKVIFEIGRFFLDLIGIVLSLTGPIGSFFASLSFSGGGDGLTNWANSVTEALRSLREIGLQEFGKGLLSFLSGDPAAALDHLGNALRSVTSYLQNAWSAFTGFFGFGGGGGNLFAWVPGAFSGVMNFMGDLFSFFAPLATAIRDAVVSAIGGIGEALSNISPASIASWLTAALNIGVLASIKGLFDSIRGISDGAKNIFSGIGGSLKNISNTIGSLNGVLKGMQNDLNAQALMKIAGAIGILAAALFLMSKIDSGKLVGATVALGALTGVLMGALYLVTRITGEYAAAKMVAISVGLGILSLAVLGFVAAVAVLSLIPMQGLIQGVIALAAVMGIMVASAALMSAIGPRMIIAAVGLNLMATAIALLVPPILLLGLIPMESLMQGLIGVGIAMGGLVVAALLLSLVAPRLLIVAPALILMAIAMNLLVVPILALGSMDYESMNQGLIGAGIALGGLVIAAAALSLLGPKLLIVAPALVVMAAALNLMVVPILLMAAIPMDQMIQGLIGVAAALGILVLAATLMGNAILGAIGMTLIAGAMLLLAISIRTLAAVPISGLVAGLIAMAVALGLAVGASAIAMVVLPGMLALAGFMLAFAAAAIAVGVASILFATGAAILAAVLPTLVSGLVKFTIWSPLIALATPLFLLIAAALLIFGAAALVAGLGVVILGVGMLAFGASLPLIVAHGPAAAEALVAFTKSIVPLIVHIPAIGLMSAAFLALGAALLVLGAGMLIAGAGAIVLGAGAVVAAAGLAILMGVGAMVSPLAARMAENFKALEAVAPGIMSFGASVGMTATSLLTFASAATASGRALVVLTASLSRVGTAFTQASSRANSASSAMSSAMSQVSTQVQRGAVSVTTSTLLIVTSFNNLSRGIASTSSSVSSAVQALINIIVSTMTGGASRVLVAINVIVTAVNRLGTEIGRRRATVQTNTRNLVNAMVTQLQSGRGRVTSAANNLANATNNMHSRISQNRTRVSNATRGLVNAAISSLNARGLRNAAANAGAQIGNGLVSGINSRLANVRAAARNISNAASSAARNGLRIASPSRVFIEIANHLVDGFLIPLFGRVGEVENATDGLAHGSVDAMQAVLDQLEDDLANMDDWDFHPTITPVLDMDAANRQAREFGGFGTGFGPDMGYAQAASLARLEGALVSALDESRESKGKTIFIQNNHSPKALDTATIYRRSKNLVSATSKREDDLNAH